ncbi:MAG: endopeptidase La [bacterium]
MKNNILDKRMEIPDKMPLLAVRDIVVFPYMVIPLSVGRQKSIKALDEAMTRGRLILLSAQKQASVEDPSVEDIYNVGTVVEILQMLKVGDGTIKLFVEGIARVKIGHYVQVDDYFEVQIKKMAENIDMTPDLEALMRNTISHFEQYVKLNRRISFDTVMSLSNITDPHRLVDVICAHLSVKLREKQDILSTVDACERLEKLAVILNSENEILEIEKKIQGRVRQQIEKTQKEYYLNEQLKAIQKELKQKDEYGKEIDEFKKKIKTSGMSKEAEEAAKKELARLEKMMPYSPEATVVRTYLDWMVNLPWKTKTEDKLDLKRAGKILDKEHYGLEKAKERILEYLAVCKLTQKLKGPILCFVGPPGTGKTSLGRSIAHTLGRKFVRISLGGIRDEAEMRGHRRTYIGSLPGRIIQSLRKAKSKNPVFLLDEIDKVGADFRGDPSAALLEILDPEQNNTFSDHYLEVDFDLSDVMFITTANTTYSILPSLQDRLEMIKFSGYTLEEKVKIAEIFLIPKQLKANGLKKEKVEIMAETIKDVIKDYTREAGVRNLERELANIFRKVAKKTVDEKNQRKLVITPQNLNKYLGISKFHRNKREKNEIGVVTGLAWTETGGETLAIEASVMKGKGNLTLTGKLGEVMQESAQAALSYVRANTKKLGIKEDFYKDKEIHIHVPEGAVPKDGPSAGIAIATAMISALTNKPVKKDIAMTGEITLRGHVLPIGGFKEKVLAAYREGIKTVIFPSQNNKDMEEIPKDIKKQLEFVLVENMSDIVGKVLVK